MGIQSMKRTKVCAIVIDIVNSTERIIRVDREDYLRVMNMFVQECAEVFAKHGITIDKFTGDGVLAYSNHPNPQFDYIERAVRAATELRERLENRRGDFEDLWLAPFDIRLGLASGYADICQYGASNSTTTLTAIGRVVNLAHRLCATALPKQILITQEIASHLEDDKFNIHECDSILLKGFEADKIKLLSVCSTQDANRPSAKPVARDNDSNLKIVWSA